jgi:hypothetical protein
MRGSLDQPSLRYLEGEGKRVSGKLSGAVDSFRRAESSSIHTQTARKHVVALLSSVSEALQMTCGWNG